MQAVPGLRMVGHTGNGGALRLRIRFQGKVFTLNLEDSATLNDLQNSIKSLTNRDDLKSKEMGIH